MGNISSYAVLDYREPMVLKTFSSGNAAFARNWFYQVAQLNKDSFLAGKIRDCTTTWEKWHWRWGPWGMGAGNQ